MMEDQNERSDMPDLMGSTAHTGGYLDDLVCTDLICLNWPIRYASVWEALGLANNVAKIRFCLFRSASVSAMM